MSGEGGTFPNPVGRCCHPDAAATRATAPRTDENATIPTPQWLHPVDLCRASSLCIRVPAKYDVLALHLVGHHFRFAPSCLLDVFCDSPCITLPGKTFFTLHTRICQRDVRRNHVSCDHCRPVTCCHVVLTRTCCDSRQYKLAPLATWAVPTWDISVCWCHKRPKGGPPLTLTADRPPTMVALKRQPCPVNLENRPRRE